MCVCVYICVCVCVCEVSCQVDQHGRPVAGAVTFCPTILTERDWKTDVSTVLHEISHIMYFSRHLINTYRYPNGTYEQIYCVVCVYVYVYVSWFVVLCCQSS